MDFPAEPNCRSACFNVRPLPVAEVHLWRFRLSQPAHVVAQLAQSLRADELARADRLRCSTRRAKAIVARGVMRDILGGYFGLPASRLQFRYGTAGKPALDLERTPDLSTVPFAHQCYCCRGARNVPCPDPQSVPASAPSLEFNLSHSHDCGVLAVARMHRLGIDLEYMEQRPGLIELAGRFFSAAEVQQFARLAPDQIDRAFYHTWVCKEAYLKALGVGLLHPLNSFSVLVDPELPPQLLAGAQRQRSDVRWSFHALGLEEGYAGALAIDAEQPTLNYFDWRPGMR